MRTGTASLSRSTAGFTLVETLVAILLLTFAIGATKLIIGAIRVDGIAARRSNLVVQAASKLEELEALPQGAPELAVGGSTTTATAGYADTVSAVERLWRIDSGPLGLLHVTIRATDLAAQAADRHGSTLTVEGYVR